jgi:RES domain-containing protein
MPMGYTSTSRSLAVLEMLVHVARDTVPADPILIPIDVPDALVAAARDLPSDWADLPYGPAARRFGDRWITQGASVALLVPSVVIPAEHNLLINPAHPALRRVRVRSAEPFAFDRCLLR